jgi:dipeptidyl aminopeptidase/acylaminoacyl peptidase
MRTSARFPLIAAVVLATAATVIAQAPQTLAPGDNLVVEGIPAIPASLARDVARYTESRSATLVDWHPQRREMLISTRFANAAQIHLVKAPGGARTQLTFETEPITSAQYQPKTGNYFVFLRDTGGDEFRQIYRYDLADGRITLVSDGKRSQNGDLVWSTSGDQLAFSGTGRNGTDRDIYVVDPAKPQTSRRLLEASGGGWLPLDWSPEDTGLLVMEFLSASKSRLWLVDATSGTKTSLTPDEEVSYGNAVFTADGKGAYITSDKVGEFQALAHLNLVTKAMTPIATGINWDIEAIELSRDGKTLALASNEAGLSHLYLMDTATRKTRPVPLPTGAGIAALKWHPNGRELGVSMTAGSAPVDVYSVDAQTLQTTRWTESELGGLPPASLIAPTLVSWRSFDNREITGFYYQPSARHTGKRPVIIDIHGGPEAQFRPTFLGRLNYFLEELGVAIIEPNVRGSTGYGKTFLSLDNGVKREESVRDIGALLDWIATQPQLDASHVMVTGGSYGGYMTLAVATHYSDRIRCALDVVGISNYNTFLKNTEAYRRDLRRVEYGDERDPKIAEFFERTAPLNNAAKIAKPLFVVQGGNDPRVPRTESEQMVAKVRQNGTPVWYLMAKDEGHGFAKKGNRDFQFYATVMFIRQYLLEGR